MPVHTNGQVPYAYTKQFLLLPLAAGNNISIAFQVFDMVRVGEWDAMDSGNIKVLISIKSIFWMDLPGYKDRGAETGVNCYR